jgi:hypothetical protein
MKTKISFLSPNQIDPSSEIGAFSDDIFENKGTFEEILLLGPHLPIGAILQKKHDLGPWMCLELVHLHATRDHIVLMDPKMITLSHDEELSLRNSVMESIEHFLGTEGQYFQQRWVFPAGEFSDLVTHSPSQAMGLNMDIWMPKDGQHHGIAKKWRKFQNEIQMIWHDHPINLARVQKGALSVNSVWVYGIGSIEQVQQHLILKDVTSIFSDHPLGSEIDPRIKPLLTQLHLPTKGEHHFIFGQDLSPTKWQALWSAAIEALQLNKIDQIECFEWQNHHWVSHHLDSNDLKPSLLGRWFKKNTPHPHSVWSEYSKTIKWSSI